MATIKIPPVLRASVGGEKEVGASGAERRRGPARPRGEPPGDREPAVLGRRRAQPLRQRVPQRRGRARARRARHGGRRGRHARDPAGDGRRRAPSDLPTTAPATGADASRQPRPADSSCRSCTRCPATAPGRSVSGWPGRDACPGMPLNVTSVRATRPSGHPARSARSSPDALPRRRAARHRRAAARRGGRLATRPTTTSRSPRARRRFPNTTSSSTERRRRTARARSACRSSAPGTTSSRTPATTAARGSRRSPRSGDVVTLESPLGTTVGAVVYDGLPSMDPTVCAGSANFSGQRSPGQTVEGSFYTSSPPTPTVTWHARKGFGEAQVKSLTGTAFGGSFLCRSRSARPSRPSSRSKRRSPAKRHLHLHERNRSGRSAAARCRRRRRRHRRRRPGPAGHDRQALQSDASTPCCSRRLQRPGRDQPARHRHRRTSTSRAARCPPSPPRAHHKRTPPALLLARGTASASHAGHGHGRAARSPGRGRGTPALGAHACTRVLAHDPAQRPPAPRLNLRTPHGHAPSLAACRRFARRSRRRCCGAAVWLVPAAGAAAAVAQRRRRAAAPVRCSSPRPGPGAARTPGVARGRAEPRDARRPVPARRPRARRLRRRCC